MDSVLFGRVVDAPLDSHGAAQCRTLATRMAGVRDLVIQTSPRRRTRQTAEAIAAQADCDVVMRRELDEIDFGDWGGQSFQALASDERWRAWNEHRGSAATPAGETIAHVQRRIAQHMEALHRTSSDRSVALVTHAEVIRSIIMHYLYMPSDAYYRLQIDAASISTVRLDDRGATVVAVNERVTE